MSGSRVAVLAIVAGLMVSASYARAAGEASETVEPRQYNPEGIRIAGTVVSTANVAGYTYVQISNDDGVVWAAAPLTQVEEGDMVLLPDGVPMRGFYSSSLDRRFDLIYFASSMQVHRSGGAALLDVSPNCPPGRDPDADLDLSGIDRPPGGLTVAAILEQKAELEGKEVLLRGKVVKCSPEILGRTWIHVRDGTLGPEGVGDVAITTNAAAAIGDTILVRGTVVLDRDFGYGYRYDLLIEDATITPE